MRREQGSGKSLEAGTYCAPGEQTTLSIQERENMVQKLLDISLAICAF
jgi:hypothetical protein